MSLVLVTTILICCTRSTEETTSVRLTLSTPNGNNLFTVNSTQIQHLVVSVTGGGMTPFIWEWDNHNNTTTAPASITVNIPTGPKLIQVGAYLKNTNGGGSFYYGDQDVSLTGSSSSVSITATAIASSSGVQGHIVGRYMGNSFLNGPVIGYVLLNNGRPPMPLIREEIFSGWFDFFAINGLKLKYVHEESKEVVFSAVEVVNPNGGTPGEILLDGQSFKVDASNHTLQVWVPQFYPDNGSGLADTTNLRDGGILLMGYFGPNRGSKMACVLSASGTYSSPNGMFTVANPGTALTYDFSTYNANKVSKIGTSGGDGAASCTGSFAYEDYLEYKDSLLRTTGFNSSVPIRSIFKNTASGPVYLLPSGSSVAITGYQLPFIWSSTTSGGIDGVDVFGLNNGATLSFSATNSDSGPGCQATASGAFGFSLQTNITEADCSTNCSKNLSNRTSLYDYHLLFCPYWTRNGQKVYVRNPYRTYVPSSFTGVSFSYSMSSGDPQMVVLPSGNNGMNCRAVTVTPSAAPNYDLNFTISGSSSGTASGVLVYDISDTGCTGSTSTTLTFASGSSAPLQFRVKATSTLGQASWTPTIATVPTAASASVSAGNFQMSVGYVLALSGTMGGSCAGPVQILVKDQYGNNVTNMSGTVTLGYSGTNSSSVLGNGCNAGLLPTSITLSQTASADLTSNIATGSALITPSGNSDFPSTPFPLNW